MKRQASQCQLVALESDIIVQAIIKGLENDKLPSTLLQIADLDINALVTTGAFAAASTSNKKKRNQIDDPPE